MKLKGKVAIVTGSGRGIGREIALLYAEEGADVTIAARTKSEVEAVAEEVRALGRRALAIPSDVTVEEQVNEVVRRTLEEFGKVDVMVNNAGGTLGTSYTTLQDTSPQVFQAVLATNITATFMYCRAVVPGMMERKDGVIINISSDMGQEGWKLHTAYSAAKFAIEGFSQGLAAELEEFNIRVNTLRPGGPVTTAAMGGRMIPGMLRTDVMRPAALFLASEDSAGITGKRFSAVEWNKENGFGDASTYLYQS